MDPRVVIVKEGTADLQLLLQIVFKLRVDVVNYGPVTTDSFITWEADTGHSKGSIGSGTWNRLGLAGSSGKCVWLFLPGP